jgi:hypothetical protein
MARELSERDRNILNKLVPEFEELQNRGIDLDYMNILPPVANHHSKDERDFESRLNRLSAEDMRYISDLILDGSESLVASTLSLQRSTSQSQERSFPARLRAN